MRAFALASHDSTPFVVVAVINLLMAAFAAYVAAEDARHGHSPAWALVVAAGNLASATWHGRRAR